jgi:2,4-dienoyl-CoA reductase-like NADH-dependent reductase (Old Yellow Enzyme family)
LKFGDYVKLKSLETVANFAAHLREAGLGLPVDESVAPDGALAAPFDLGAITIGNRFAIQPMEGWDGALDGTPTENTLRRWKRFGASGAKLIWGGEAVAVRHDGRANPNQLTMTAATQGAIAGLREALVAAHRTAMGDDRGLYIGLQLTHSGRFSGPNVKRRLEPKVLYAHPILDRKFNLDAAAAMLSDGEIRELVEDYVVAARRAAECGFDFVDLKHCHGYLGHEFLSAKTRPGEYGGSLENRTRFLRELVAGIRAVAPRLEIGMRISAFDSVPFRPDPVLSRAGALGPGVPDDYSGCLPYRYGFGLDENNPMRIDLTETKAVLAQARELGIRLVNVSAGSPYYSPHLTRPALYPPSDGYHPPEDPLTGVLRNLSAVRELKAAFPSLAIVGSGLSYLQEFLPNVAQAVVREGWLDFVGLGRMVLAYPEFPADVLAGRALQRKRLCRTFSDCTTAPRNGMVSGCYPLDPHYKRSPENAQLAMVKKAANLA